MFCTRSRQYPAGRSFAQIEQLENRRLLSADPLTVVVGAGAAKSVQFTAANGTQAQIMLNGPGTASVQFDGSGLSQSANAKGLIVSGSGIALTSITVNGTTGTSTLMVVTRGKHALSSGDITVGGALNGLLAPNLTVTGNVSTGAGLHQLQLAGATGGAITVGSGKVGTLIVKMGSASEEGLNSAIPIVSLSASQWTNTAADGKSITAPQINLLNVTHDYSVDTTTASMNSMKVRGTLSNCTINLTMPLNRGMNLNSLVVGGAIDGVTINSGNNLGSIVAAKLQDSQIYAGLVASPSAPLPTVSADFRNTSTIKLITLRRSASASFVNSDIAAYTIGNATLGGADQANGGTPYGLAAHAITSVTIVDEGSGKTVHVSKPTTTTSFNNALVAKGVTPVDLTVRIV
jgi:hypothetical protein